MSKAVPHLVFLHGLNCSGNIFNHLKSQLPEHTSTIIEYDSPQKIEDSLEQVIYEIPALIPITIIGHSLGGILGHLLCTRNILNLNVQKLVSIATPFGGSDIAGLFRWFFPTFSILKDLSPGSKILKEVGKTPINVPFLSLISVDGSMPFISEPNDGIVSVSSQKAIDATRRVEIKTNHFEIVQHPTTVLEIKKFVFK